MGMVPLLMRQCLGYKVLLSQEDHCGHNHVGSCSGAQKRGFGEPQGPCREALISPPHSSMMPGMAGGSSALNSLQCLGQQVFGEGGTNKGYVQQWVYGCRDYPRGSGFTIGYAGGPAGGPAGLGLPSHVTRPSTNFTQAAVVAAQAAATAKVTATVVTLQERQSQELSQYRGIGAKQLFNCQFLQHRGPSGPSVPSSRNSTSVGGLMGPLGMSPMGMNPTPGQWAWCS